MVTRVGTDSANTLTGTSGVDTLDGRGGNDTLYGYAGIDNLLGGLGNDLIYTGDGYDLAYGGGGSDKLYGENGNDKLYGEDGNDYLYGGYGGDTLVGGYGDDYLEGGPGGDLIQGGYGADRLYGGTSADSLYGGADNDILDPGSGGNFTYGDSGNDTIYITDSTDGYLDTVDGGTGYDTLSFAKLSHGVGDYLTGGYDLITSGNEVYLRYSTETLTINEVVAKGIEKLVGSNYADFILHSENNRGVPFYGGGGNDYMDGWSEFHGGSGNDEITPRAGSTVWGDSGYDSFNLHFSTYSAGRYSAQGAVVKDFQPGIDKLYFFEGGTNEQLTHSGDLWTVTWFDNDTQGTASATFELDGITSLSASDYLWV